jgi:NADH-quinone oxidoreductase subunit M
VGAEGHPALASWNALGFPLLSITIFLPLAGALVVSLVRAEARGLHYALGVLFAGLTAVLTVVEVWQFERGVPGFQFTDRPAGEWLPGGITYQVGVDGIGIVLLGLTGLLTLIALAFSWGSVRVRTKEFVILLLVLETGLLGVFAAMDLFLFYVFWELVLIPMALLVGVWGGAGRVYASLKFVLYTLAGSALMLVGIVVLKHLSGSATFALTEILAQPPVDLQAQWLLFGAFVLAFAVKVPLFPFHTWLPDAHVEAPTAGSIVLAGVLLKMGTYGFLRLAMPLFPEAAVDAAPWMMGAALVGIWYGAWVAFAQSDVKSLVAYSSVGHMGLVVLGLFAVNAIGVDGAVMQMLSHGLTTGALFLLVGILYDRAHTRQIASFGGLWRQMPVYSALFVLVALASIGLPGLSGFVGEWLVLAGAFRAEPVLGALAAFGMVLGAAYMLWMIQRVFFGPAGPSSEGLTDITAREALLVLPLAILIVWIGVNPEPFLGLINDTTEHWVTLIARGALPVAGR